MNETLPPELAELERDVASHPVFCPPATLRGRVLERVRMEVVHRRRRANWYFAAAAAAIAAVMINFSMSAVQETDLGLQAHALPASIASTAEQIRAILPELSEDEARRQAVLMLAMPDGLGWTNVRQGGPLAVGCGATSGLSP